MPAGKASTGMWWRLHSQRLSRCNSVLHNHTTFPTKCCTRLSLHAPSDLVCSLFCDQLELGGHSGRSLHPTPAASLESGLPCLLLEQTLAQSQRKVEENLRDFTHATSCRSREGVFLTTKTQSWSANLSCSKQQCCQSCSLHLLPCRS